MMEYKDGSRLTLVASGGDALKDLQAIIDARQRDPRIVSVKTVGPNEKCVCGSGKKFKRCCMFKG